MSKEIAVCILKENLQDVTIKNIIKEIIKNITGTMAVGTTATTDTRIQVLLPFFLVWKEHRYITACVNLKT
jgi:hypothetical protein